MFGDARIVGLEPLVEGCYDICLGGVSFMRAEG